MKRIKLNKEETANITRLTQLQKYNDIMFFELTATCKSSSSIPPSHFTGITLGGARRWAKGKGHVTRI